MYSSEFDLYSPELQKEREANIQRQKEQDDAEIQRFIDGGGVIPPGYEAYVIYFEPEIDEEVGYVGPCCGVQLRKIETTNYPTYDLDAPDAPF